MLKLFRINVVPLIAVKTCYRKVCSTTYNRNNNDKLTHYYPLPIRRFYLHR